MGIRIFARKSPSIRTCGFLFRLVWANGRGSGFAYEAVIYCFTYRILKKRFEFEMNQREKIDLDKWNRAELFREFIGMATSIYDMTVRMDVTNLVNHCKETAQSFFINYLYLALRELNAIPEFRMRIHDGEPYLYDKVDCSFTVANQFGYFVNRSAAFTEYKPFYQRVSATIEEAKHEKNTHPQNSDLARTDLIYFSAIPWIDYQSMTLPVLTNPSGTSDQTYNIVPCVGWGKYVEENQLLKMSMHMKISHAFIDGKPLADAFNHIQAAIDELDFYK